MGKESGGDTLERLKGKQTDFEKLTVMGMRPVRTTLD